MLWREVPAILCFSTGPTNTGQAYLSRDLRERLNVGCTHEPRPSRHTEVLLQATSARVPGLFETKLRALRLKSSRKGNRSMVDHSVIDMRAQ